MGMGFAPTWLRQVSPPASQNHFNHCSQYEKQRPNFAWRSNQMWGEFLHRRARTLTCDLFAVANLLVLTRLDVMTSQQSQDQEKTIS